MYGWQWQRSRVGWPRGPNILFLFTPGFLLSGFFLNEICLLVIPSVGFFFFFFFDGGTKFYFISYVCMYIINVNEVLCGV